MQNLNIIFNQICLVSFAEFLAIYNLNDFQFFFLMKLIDTFYFAKSALFR